MGFDVDMGDKKIAAVGIPTPGHEEGHIRILPPGVLFCAHCGDHYEMARPVATNVLVGAMNGFTYDHKKCPKEERGIACDFCFMFGHARLDCPRLRYSDTTSWFHGPDTGMSSKTLYFKLVFGAIEDQSQAPRDADDFGRCYRFLKAFPQYRPRITEMRDVPGWGKIADAWDELEALYEEEFPTGLCPKLYAKMAALRGESP